MERSQAKTKQGYLSPSHSPISIFIFFLLQQTNRNAEICCQGYCLQVSKHSNKTKKYKKKNKITDKQTQKRGGHCCFFVCYFFSNYSNKHQNKQKIKEQNKNKNRQTNRNAGSCCRRGRPQGTAAGVGAGNSIVQRWRFSSADVSTYCLLLSCTLFLIYFGYETYEDL